MLERTGFIHLFGDDLICNIHKIIIKGIINGIGVYEDNGGVYIDAPGIGLLKVFNKGETAPLEEILIEDSVTGILGGMGILSGN